MSQDHVDVQAQQVANGLGIWDPAASNFQARWKDLTSQIDGLIEKAPWGHDEPGTTFDESFCGDGKARELTATGNEIVQRVVDTGKDVRRTCEASFGADQQQAAEVGIDVPHLNLST
ncbi:MAG: hypothetical protein M3313_07135 [Actinomycetota bacterium]|nr:hypothetical protein [Actinomycetota bacterium]